MAEKQENENQILVDYSIFKWMSFIPGETSVDDICVMKFNGSTTDLFRKMLPEEYFSPCYTLQFLTSGSFKAYINNRTYDIQANDGYLIIPEFFMRRMEPTSQQMELYVICISRKFMAEMNLQFPLSLISHIYIHPVWHMSAEKVQGVIHYFDLLREVVASQNRTATMFLVYSLFHFLAGDIANAKMRAPSMSRNEEITGRFMHLVDAHCEQQHSLDWYADQPLPLHTLRSQHHQRDTRHSCQFVYRTRTHATRQNTSCLHAYAHTANSRPTRLPEPKPFRHILQAPRRNEPCCL